MSNRLDKKKACSGPPKTRNRPYDNRPGSGRAPAKQRAPRKADAIRVDLPDELTLTPEAAWALLRILIKARDRRNGTDNPQGAAQ
jgi:hypothetical protein